MNRSEHINKLQNNNFDLFIIGGGINGAGIARDASMRGLSVALVEAKDFASGTSSKSSKLIHGGIRYLENFDFHLVFEALSERSCLYQMAPHLVHPLRFMIPLFADSRVGMFKMGLGMWLYDALSLFRAPKLHERLNAEETQLRMPILKEHNLKGSYVYSDAYMDDDRLVHETLRSAIQHKAVISNYVKMDYLKKNDALGLYEIQCRDAISGQVFTVTAKKVISTVGAWTDEVGKNINLNWTKKLRPTKGIHLTLPKDRLPLQSAVVMGAENSDRIVFAIPRHEMVIIGTTDTDYHGSPTDVGATAEDVSYLLKVAQSYFPNAKLQNSDFIASYAGVRPLVKDDAGSEGKTSREHSIWTDQNSGVTFVAGGKYTTYRLIAQQAVDFIFGKKSVVDTKVSLNSWTSPMSYQESLSKVQEFSDKYSVPVHAVKMLCERYGMETPEILHKYKQYKNYWQIEAAQAIETTMCLNLLDFYTRRVPLFLAERNHGLDYMNDIAIVFQELLNLIDAQIELQKKDLTEFINKELAWKRCTDE